VGELDLSALHRSGRFARTIALRMPIWRSDAAIRSDDRGCRITAWGRAFAAFLEFARQISGWGYPARSDWL
jgi:hypothetical protein